MRRDTSELLAAYVDGVGELTVEERRRVERHLSDPASGPAARSDEGATRDLLAKLRELPATSEPDWAALERSIQDAVPDRMPRGFWRGWRFAIPVLALGSATLIALAVTTHASEPEAPVAVVEHHETVAPVVAEDPIEVYLDGDDMELPLDAADLADLEIDDLTYDGIDDPDAAEEFMAADDLQWIDDLDDNELERASGWLDHPHHRSKG